MSVFYVVNLHFASLFISKLRDHLIADGPLVDIWINKDISYLTFTGSQPEQTVGLSQMSR